MPINQFPFGISFWQHNNDTLHCLCALKIHQSWYVNNFTESSKISYIKIMHIVIAQNDTSLPVTTFPWLCCMSTLLWWHFMKVTEKTPNLEDPYLELCNSIWPHLYTIGKVSELAKTFLKTPKSENFYKYPKNEIFWCICEFP